MFINKNCDNEENAFNIEWLLILVLQHKCNIREI